MGRPGGGGGHSSVSRSSGGHSVSRSSGGHRVGGSSSSRPMGGSSRPSGGFGGGRPSGGHYGAPPTPPRHHSAPPPPPRHYGAPPPPPRHYGAPPPPPHRGGYYERAPRRRGGCVSEILSWFIAFLIIIIALGFYMAPRGGGSTGSVPSSSYNREKLNTGNGYINDCIYDELGWFENESRTESRLKDFYNETGVQPFIIIKAYNPEYVTDEEREDWAKILYDEYIDNESTFLYVYFEDEVESDDSGYMCYVGGTDVSAVMDSEAVDIFWAYLDSYWNSNLSVDDVFVKTFNSTATRIMTKTTTSNDVKKYVLIAVAAGVVIFGVVKVVKLKHKRAKEEAEETERILNTPMENLVDEELKKTAAKYDEQK